MYWISLLFSFYSIFKHHSGTNLQLAETMHMVSACACLWYPETSEEVTKNTFSKEILIMISSMPRYLPTDTCSVKNQTGWARKLLDPLKSHLHPSTEPQILKSVKKITQLAHKVLCIGWNYILYVKALASNNKKLMIFRLLLILKSSKFIEKRNTRYFAMFLSRNESFCNVLGQKYCIYRSTEQ